MTPDYLDWWLGSVGGVFWGSRAKLLVNSNQKNRVLLNYAGVLLSVLRGKETGDRRLLIRRAAGKSFRKLPFACDF